MVNEDANGLTCVTCPHCASRLGQLASQPPPYNPLCPPHLIAQTISLQSPFCSEAVARDGEERGGLLNFRLGAGSTASFIESMVPTAPTLAPQNMAFNPAPQRAALHCMNPHDSSSEGSPLFFFGNAQDFCFSAAMLGVNAQFRLEPASSAF